MQTSFLKFNLRETLCAKKTKSHINVATSLMRGWKSK